MGGVLLLGVDENGLGPRLGPLVVTSVSAHAEDARARAFALGKPQKSVRATIDDSKTLVAFGNDALGEAWARAIAARSLGRDPQSVSETLRATLIDDEATLSMPCPTGHAPQCWGGTEPAFTAGDDLMRTVSRTVAKLSAKGVDLRRARSVVACTRVLNDAARRGVSRFRVDLSAMERLVVAAHTNDAVVHRSVHGGPSEGDGELRAVCGKVGGYDFYGDAFDTLSGYLPVALREGRKDSTYLVRGIGTVSFVQDADAQCLLVSLASLVGKWVRDLLMNRIITHWRSHDAALPSASGYHDPVTARFVAATALVRTRVGFEDACFERERARPRAPATSSEPREKTHPTTKATTTTATTKRTTPTKGTSPTKRAPKARATATTVRQPAEGEAP